MSEASPMGRTIIINGPSPSRAPKHLLTWLDCVDGAMLTRRGGRCTDLRPDMVNWEEWTLYRGGRSVGIVLIDGLELRNE